MEKENGESEKTFLIQRRQLLGRMPLRLCLVSAKRSNPARNVAAIVVTTVAVATVVMTAAVTAATIAVTTVAVTAANPAAVAMSASRVAAATAVSHAATVVIAAIPARVAVAVAVADAVVVAVAVAVVVRSQRHNLTPQLWRPPQRLLPKAQYTIKKQRFTIFFNDLTTLIHELRRVNFALRN